MLQPLWWKSADVSRLIEQALAADEHRDGVDEDATPSPRLLLVHDVSVYLLSSARTEVVEPVFADGLNPLADEGWVARVRQHVPEDDFTESLDIDAMRSLVAAAPDGWIRMTYDDARLHVAAFATRSEAA